jgi:Sec-independent protein translocase protein TatA
VPDPAIAFISPGGGELILIMLVLILLFGAKDAPRILRSIQTLLDKMQRMAADFRYKIMYGDLHNNTTEPVPYDAEDREEDVDILHEGDEPPLEPDEEKETVQSSEFHVQSSEKESHPDTENPEPGTEDSELKT